MAEGGKHRGGGRGRRQPRNGARRTSSCRRRGAQRGWRAPCAHGAAALVDLPWCPEHEGGDVGDALPTAHPIDTVVGSVAHGGGPSRLAAMEPAARPAAPAAGGRSSHLPRCASHQSSQLAPRRIGRRSPQLAPIPPLIGAGRLARADGLPWMAPRARCERTRGRRGQRARAGRGGDEYDDSMVAHAARSRRYSLFLCRRPRRRCLFFSSFARILPPRARFRVPCCLLLRFLVPTAPRRQARPPPSGAPPSRSWWTPLELTLPLELEAVAEERGAGTEGGGASSSGGRRDRPAQDRWKRRRRRSVLVEWWWAGGWGVCG
jgi:hypothetical protein